MPEVKGSVTQITVNRDGTTEVIVDRSQVFIHPDDLTDDQLEALERAQNHNKDVTVKWTKKGEVKVVASVTVHS